MRGNLGPSAMGTMLRWLIIIEDFGYHFQERAPGFCLEGVQRCISLVARPGGGPGVGGQHILARDWKHTRNIRVPRGITEVRHPRVLLNLLVGAAEVVGHALDPLEVCVAVVVGEVGECEVVGGAGGRHKEPNGRGGRNKDDLTRFALHMAML